MDYESLGGIRDMWNGSTQSVESTARLRSVSMIDREELQEWMLLMNERVVNEFIGYGFILWPVEERVN